MRQEGSANCPSTISSLFFYVDSMISVSEFLTKWGKVGKILILCSGFGKRINSYPSMLKLYSICKLMGV